MLAFLVAERYAPYSELTHSFPDSLHLPVLAFILPEQRQDSLLILPFHQCAVGIKVLRHALLKGHRRAAQAGVLVRTTYASIQAVAIEDDS